MEGHSPRPMGHTESWGGLNYSSLHCTRLCTMEKANPQIPQKQQQMILKRVWITQATLKTWSICLLFLGQTTHAAENLQPERAHTERALRSESHTSQELQMLQDQDRQVLSSRSQVQWCTPAILGVEAGGFEFEARLGDIANTRIT